MSKKQWLLAILVIAFLGYLIISKINPTWGGSIDNVVGGSLGGLKTGIEASPIWQQYDVWFATAFGAIVAALVVYRGRNFYDGVRGIARVRATDRKVTFESQREPEEPEKYSPPPKETKQEEPQKIEQEATA